MNNILNQNFIVSFLLAGNQGLTQQQRLFAGLAASQMDGGSLMGPLLLQPLIKDLATEEKGRTTAEASAAALQQRLEVELPVATQSARVSVPGVAANLSRVDGSQDTTFDSATGVVGLPTAHDEETISIAVDGTSRQVTIVRGARATNTDHTTTGRQLTERELADLGRALLVALQAAARTGETTVGQYSPTRSREPGLADRSPARGGQGSSGQGKERAGQQRNEGNAASSAPADAGAQSSAPAAS